jgi:hypothetical protein
MMTWVRRRTRSGLVDDDLCKGVEFARGPV